VSLLLTRAVLVFGVHELQVLRKAERSSVALANSTKCRRSDFGRHCCTWSDHQLICALELLFHSILPDQSVCGICGGRCGTPISFHQCVVLTFILVLLLYEEQAVEALGRRKAMLFLQPEIKVFSLFYWLQIINP